jgi:hypothetical protein
MNEKLNPGVLPNTIGEAETWEVVSKTLSHIEPQSEHMQQAN